MKHWHWLSGVIFSSLLSFSSATIAAESPSKPADIRIIVDISGSMKHTDPANLRIPAVNLLVELLPEHSRAGIWTFGRYVNMLVPLAEVDNAWRAQAKDKAKQINSVGLQTNLPEALERALWKIAPNSDYDQTVILLTDGRIDLNEVGTAADINERERERLLQTILPKYINAGAKIHTLALSSETDQDLLAQIALESGGLFLRAETADELLKAFLQAFDRAVPTEQVPMHDNQFVIDDSVSEFTALIFRSSDAAETKLIAPNDTVYQKQNVDGKSVRWHSDVNYDLITVANPAAGQWRAEAQLDADNRVQILSDMSLKVSGVPERLFVGDALALQVALQNTGTIINEPTLLAVTDFSLTLQGNSAQRVALSNKERLPDNGVFTHQTSAFERAGNYRLDVDAVSQTFQRRFSTTVAVLEPFSVAVNAQENQNAVLITVHPQAGVDAQASKIMAHVTAPNGTTIAHEMPYQTGANAWQYELKPAQGDGVYRVALTVRGITEQGASFRARPADIEQAFPLTGFEQKPIVAEPEPAVTPEPLVMPEPAVEEPADFSEPADIDTPTMESALVEAPVEAEVSESEVETAVEESSEGLPSWLLWTLVIAGNTLLAGGLGYWVWRHRGQAPQASNSASKMAKNSDKPQAGAAPATAGAPMVDKLDDLSIPLADNLPVDDIAPEDLAGSFDDVEDMEEVEIVFSPDSSAPDITRLSTPEPVVQAVAEPDIPDLPMADEMADWEASTDELEVGSQNDHHSTLDASDEVTLSLDDMSLDIDDVPPTTSTASLDDDDDWGEFDLPDDDKK